jgi:hypothetical protein
MRNSVLKCENCSDEFGSRYLPPSLSCKARKVLLTTSEFKNLHREELQNHAPGCYSWSSVHDKTLQAMERPYGKDGWCDTLLAQSRGLTQSFDGRSYAGPPSAYPTFDSPESRYLANYHASDFTQVMPSVPSSGSVIPPTPPLVPSSFDGSYVHASSSPNVFSHRRQSISSSSNVSILILFLHKCEV